MANTNRTTVNAARLPLQFVLCGSAFPLFLMPVSECLINDLLVAFLEWRVGLLTFLGVYTVTLGYIRIQLR